MQSPLPPVAVVLAFVDRINRGDLDGLLALTTTDHVLRILDEPPVSGAALRRAWQGYFTAFPRYVIHPVQVAADGNTVTVLGNTTGSHLGLPDEEELKEDVIWSGEVRDGRLSCWSILADTVETRRARGLPLPRVGAGAAR
jgi:ketosteroid isomerase-like protein